MMARRISGSDGCGGGPLRRSFSPPPRRLQAPVLQIGKGDAGHQRVPMQPGPGPAFEVAKPELLLELLVHLLARPARLDGGDQPAQRGPLRQVAEVVLRLAAVAPFADQPEFLARQAGALDVERPVSATRTRTAAKRALSGPLVPLRQVMRCQRCVASISAAESGARLGSGCLAGRPPGVRAGRSLTV